jgi:rfaE bifunctional protein nucleotidyltransferase chain/domain
MNKITTIDQASKLSLKFKQAGKIIILAGGCFDILHLGHLKFLEKAKEQGDLLFLLLESDENIKKRKGENRPINKQSHRASILSALPYVDYIIPLEEMTKDEEYDKLIVQIKPAVIAITSGDKHIEKRKMQCEMIGAQLKEVINQMDSPSTTDLIKQI